MKKEKCSYCDGKGFLNIPTYWSEEISDYIMKEDDCPQCEGLGKLNKISDELDFSDLIYFPKK